MDTTHGTLARTPRRTAAAVVAISATGLVAGGAGGYLLHRTTPAPAAVQVVAAPAAPHGLNGDSAGGYTLSHAATPPSEALNRDSASGYGVGTSAARGGLNGDSTSGY